MLKNKYRNWEIQIGEAVSVRKGGKPGSSSPARPTLSPAFPVWCRKDDKYMKYKYKYRNTEKERKSFEGYRNSIA